MRVYSCLCKMMLKVLFLNIIKYFLQMKCMIVSSICIYQWYFADMDERERCRKAYYRLKLMADASSSSDAARIAARSSNWAPAHGKQWKEINRIVTTDMVKSIWPGVSSDAIGKGRLKLDRCSNNNIKENAEAIYLACSGTTLFHTDCPLWFAKMLYCQFVMEETVDFSSRAPHKVVDDIRSETLTVSREELRYALAGAAMETHDNVEELQIQVTQLKNAKQPADEDTSRDELKRDIKLLMRQLHEAEERGQHQSAMTAIEHPNSIEPPPQAPHVAGGPCPLCRCFFHAWSGHYALPCGHMYHVTCLMQSMVNSKTCAICPLEISRNLYAMFKMSRDYERLVEAQNKDHANTLSSLDLSL